LRARLILVFTLFLLTMAGVGLVGINRLSEVNAASAEIQSHWLRAAPLLGELNNLISDFRALEANTLLDAGAGQDERLRDELVALDQCISRTRAGYEQIRMDAEEERLYTRFRQDWAAYRDQADRVFTLARAGQRAEGVALYRGNSHRAFSVASNTLAELVAHNVNGAQHATEREIGLYRVSRGLIWTAILVAACILVAAIVYITRQVARPLVELAGSMHSLAAGATDVDVGGVQRRDEIGAMARAVLVFRANAVGLIRSQNALSEQAETLRASLDAERRVTTQQQNFVSMTSHEFRTPLTIIDSHAQRLIRMKDRLKPDDLAARAQGIRAAVLRMTRLMDSLLASSRVLDGEARLRPERIDLAALLREVCQMHREVSPAARIEEEIGSEPAPLAADPRLLHQAFSNLVSNAIKYSPAGSPVQVRLTARAHGHIVEIIDHGIGIPAQDLPHLFERYFRGSNVSDIAGTGVGLYLVEMVIGLHGGIVKAASREGEGCRIRIELPPGVLVPPEK
jgi:signal transduction histidine kinase